MQLDANSFKILSVLYEDINGQHFGLSLGQATGLHNGVLYPILDKLENNGMIRNEWEKEPKGRRPRLFYKITGEGIRIYEENRIKHQKSTEVRYA